MLFTPNLILGFWRKKCNCDNCLHYDCILYTTLLKWGHWCVFGNYFLVIQHLWPGQNSCDMLISTNPFDLLVGPEKVTLCCILSSLKSIMLYIRNPGKNEWTQSVYIYSFNCNSNNHEVTIGHYIPELGLYIRGTISISTRVNIEHRSTSNQ